MSTSNSTSSEPSGRQVFLNGDFLHADQPIFNGSNRAFRYGDAVFETLRYQAGKLWFAEDHYFRLMSGMRIHRMEIPMTWTPEFLEESIRATLRANRWETTDCRVRMQVYRDAEGWYTPADNRVGLFIEVEPHSFAPSEAGGADSVRVQLYTDFYKVSGALSNSKAASAHLYVLAGIFARENGYDEALLVNEKKHLIEGHASNVFLVYPDQIRTPALSEGCVKGVMRKKVIEHAATQGLEVLEEAISPFDLLKAEEVWLTNVIRGIRPVTHYRKKNFGTELGLRWQSEIFGH